MAVKKIYQCEYSCGGFSVEKDDEDPNVYFAFWRLGNAGSVWFDTETHTLKTWDGVVIV